MAIALKIHSFIRDVLFASAVSTRQLIRYQRFQRECRFTSNPVVENSDSNLNLNNSAKLDNIKIGLTDSNEQSDEEINKDKTIHVPLSLSEP